MIGFYVFGKGDYIKLYDFSEVKEFKWEEMNVLLENKVKYYCLNIFVILFFYSNNFKNGY